MKVHLIGLILSAATIVTAGTAGMLYHRSKKANATTLRSVEPVGENPPTNMSVFAMSEPLARKIEIDLFVPSAGELKFPKK
jgi:hypothetical protein